MKFPQRVLVRIITNAGVTYSEGVAMAANSFGDVFVVLTPREVTDRDLSPNPALSGGWYPGYTVGPLV